MKNRIIAGLLAVAGLVGGAVWAYPREGQCAFCPKITCVDQKICGQGCVCVTDVPSTPGKCMAANP